jgi:HPt (histidine-containing phosphotransfer) domain-containing protein
MRPVGAPIDFEQLENVSGGDSAFEAELLCEFCELTSELIEQLGEAVGKGDSDEIRSLAHTIKGSAKTIGAFELGNISERIELAARVGDLVDIAEDAAQLASAFQSLAVFVQKHCTSDAA